MSEEGKEKYESAMQSHLQSRLSRATLLKATGLAAIAAAVPKVASADGFGPPGFSFPFSPGPNQTLNGRYTAENITDILNIAQTAEHFAVTFLTAALGNAAAIGLTGPTLGIVQAILAEEIVHVQFLAGAGAKSLTDSFTVPDPKAISDYTTFFKNVEAADTIFVGAYMAAAREFAELGQPILAKIAFQIGGVEAEHRALARALLLLKGDAASNPPNNKAFETDLFVYVREAAALLTQLGFLGGSGTPAAFPGLAAATAAAGPIAGAIIQKAPNNASEGSTKPSNITAEHS